MDDNPFADPSVTSAQSGPPEEYNPFDDDTTGFASFEESSVASTTPTSQQDVSVDFADEGQPQSSNAAGDAQNTTGLNLPPLVGQSTAGMFDHLPVEERLKQREFIINDREAKIRERRLLLEMQWKKKPNWPFECYPLAYHSIKDEVMPEHRSLCRKYYLLVRLVFLCQAYNLICQLAIWWTPSSHPDDSWAFNVFVGALYFSIGCIAAWKWWYRSVYSALSKPKASKFYVHLIGFAAHIAFALLMLIGIPSFAMSGFWTMVDMFNAESKSKDTLGVMCLINVGLWTIVLAASVLLIKKTYNLFKLSGGRAAAEQQLKQEGALTAAQNAI